MTLSEHDSKHHEVVTRLKVNEGSESNYKGGKFLKNKRIDKF